EGNVFIEFVVEKDGAITAVKSLKGIGAGCDEEAVKVINKAPKWKPGKQRGKAVRVRIVLPIHFRLS
ncbi:MAG: energy transducer TonB, partial [Bacteroidetes bacterium]|nr:energy transducer TonB [Bacteroidota bacterium]